MSHRLGREFGRLLAANIATNAGDGVVVVVAPLLALQLTDDPLLVSGVAAASMLPWLLTAIPGGVLVDRVGGRGALIWASLARVIVATTLLALITTGALTIAWIFILVFAFGVGETVADSAVRATMPALVTPAQLPTANGRVETSDLIAQRFTSQPAASLLFSATPVAPAAVTAATFVVAAIAATGLPKPPTRSAPGRNRRAHETLRGQMAAGMRTIVAHPALRILCLMSVLGVFWFSAAWGSYAIRLVDGLGLPEVWLGPYLLLQGIGGLLGSVLAAPLARRMGAGRTITVASSAVGAGIILIGTPSLVSAGAGFVLSSIGILVANVHITSVRQRLVPTRLLGRVNGTWRTVVWGVMPIGALLGGALGRVDLALPFLVGGGAYVVVALVFARALMRLPDVQHPQ